MKNISKLIILLVLTISIGVSGCNEKKTGLAEKKAKLDKLKAEQSKLDKEITTLEAEIAAVSGAVEIEKVSVSVYNVQLDTFRRYINFQGMVESQKAVVLSVKMGGQVSKFYVHEGEMVQKGALMMETNTDVMNKTLEELQSSLEFVNKVYTKQKNLYDQKAISEIQFLEAKNNKESLENKLKTLKEQIADSKIFAPFSGYVDRIIPKLGEITGPGAPAIYLTSMDEIKVTANVSESYAATIKAGDPVSVYFDDLNETVNAKVNVVSKAIDQRNRTFRIEINSAKLPSNARPNMACALTVNDVVVPNALVIPLKGLQRDGEKYYVFVADNSNPAVARKKYVQVGMVSGNEAQITGGLQENEKVITDGNLDVSDGQEIEIK